jgi:hypothetical protein
MKTLFKTFVLFLILVIYVSCDKNEESPVTQVETQAPLQDPLPGFLSASGYNQLSSILINSFDREFGFSFIPLVNGTATAIVVKLPEARNGVRVTFWDKSAGTVVRTETIDVPTVGVEATKNISPLNLVKDKEYFISMNSNDCYQSSRTNYTPAEFPYTVGDFKITSVEYKAGSSQSMPNTPIGISYDGNCSFKFQK